MATADDRYRKDLTWEEKAAINPLYAVMSTADYRDKGGDPSEWSAETIADFFEKGQRLYEINVLPIVTRLGLGKKDGFVVEYGSGMGRILKAVAADGYRCAGIDISPTMLDLSRKLVPEVSDLHVLKDDLTCDVPSNSANIVYSYAVLQHIKALSGVRIAISEMCRIAKPRGRLRFQIYCLERPWGDLVDPAPVSVFNAEHETTLVYPPDATGAANIKVIPHTNWNGAPLAISTVRAWLEEFGVQMTGLNQDLKSASAFWVDGRKLG